MGGSEDQCHLQKNSKLEVSLDCMRFHLKKKNKDNKTNKQ